MKILFEDSPNSPISKLISMYMDNCVFVSSWHNIEANMDDTSIAFLDVSPNNKKTIWAYRDLQKCFQEEYLYIHVQNFQLYLCL